MKIRRIASILCASALCALIVAAQQPQPNPPAAQGAGTIRVTTQLVIETVAVKDKSGKPVEGLGLKDFSLTEDGVPQTINFVEFQKLEDTVDTAANSAATAPPSNAAVSIVPPATRNEIAPETPGDTRYRDHRLLVLYFDRSTMPIADQLRAYGAAQKFINTQMRPADMLAIITFEEGAIHVRQDFTGDRAQLQQALDKVVAISEGLDETISDDSSADTGAAFGQDDAEFNIFNTDRQLAALQTAVKMLGTVNEQKSLLYFASGLRLNGTDNQAQLVATTNAALRANVLLYPIDARGLVAAVADRRRVNWIEWRHRHVLGQFGASGDDKLPAIPGHPLRSS